MEHVFKFKIDGDTSDTDNLFVTKRLTGTGAEYTVIGKLAMAIQKMIELETPSPEDYNIELIYKGTGTTKSPGGQHAGSHPTDIRVTHKETGLMAQCGDLRSQYKNREVALKMLATGLKEVNK